MNEDRAQRLTAFADWGAKHITGDEKGEAHIFLDRLFQAFAQKGLLEAGGQAEFRLKKASEDGGGTSFADCVWKPIVLFEMKKRGADLRKHYRQAFDYWTRIAPGRPQYVVLCNFDEFWVYDFNNQLDSPKDIVKLTELPQRWGPLAFLFPTREKPTFGNDREVVTREAADRLALCFKKLITRQVDRNLAQRFILQSLIALFAEDIGLLPKYLFGTLVEECKTPADSYDLIGGLFEAMNNAVSPAGGRYKGVRYFNGGIFAHPARLELHEDELNQLKGTAASDWSKVSPEIFGAIFQDSMDKEERHAFGAHYTSPVDIMKIVKPTIADPWTAAIDGARSSKKLGDLLERLTTLRVLDPACGSGNFLYLAYREMKRLETRIRERLTSEFPEFQPRLIHVNARQFFGMDINPFAIELAKVTLMLGRKLAIDELHIADERDLPLDNLDANFQAVDALLTAVPAPVGSASADRLPDSPPPATANPYAQVIQTPWPAAEIIIGNPPFLGAKRLKPERGPDYVNAVRKLYPEVPGMADYCVYWIRRAHDHLPPCTKDDPLAGRAGLVGTQNIRNNQSRVGGLDHVVQTGTILEAVDNQPWSGEANVHVSIVNWTKTHDAAVLPKARMLWQKAIATSRGTKATRKGRRADKTYELTCRLCTFINSALSDTADVSAALILACNQTPQRVFQGNTPGHDGFVLNHDEHRVMVAADPRSVPAIYPYLIGREILTGDGKPERWIIDFQQQTMIDAQQYRGAFEHVRLSVLPTIREKADAEKEANKKRSPGAQDDTRQNHLERWWMHWRGRADRVEACKSLNGRCLVCSRVTKRPIFVFIDLSMRPGDALQTFTFDDDYSFGILQSNAHWQWFIAKCSKLKSDFRYTPESVFDTFPWPQSPGKKQIDAVAAAGREIRRIRADALTKITGGLRALYRTLELPGQNPLKDAHAAVDSAVLAAYGFDPKGDLLAQLLELNLAVAMRESQGLPVTAPGVPATYGDAAGLVTEDCIRP